jgi:hypothetical protein
MTKKIRTIGYKMNQAKVILANVQKEPFKSALKKYGYNEARIQVGQVLLDETQALINAQAKAQLAQIRATRKLKAYAKKAGDYFTKQAIIARLALGNDKELFKDLGISGRKKKSYSGWTSDAITFYTHALANPEILDVLTQFGVTVNILKKGLTLIEDLDPLYSKQKNRKGLAQVATPKKNEKMKELFKWISKLIGFARIEFKNNSQQLERFMVKVYSKGYSPKKADEKNEIGS